MKELSRWLLVLMVVFAVGCSSSSESDDDSDELPDEVPVSEADTDEVPDEEDDEFGDDEDGDELADEDSEEDAEGEEEEVADNEDDLEEDEPEVADTAPAQSVAGSGEFDQYTVRSGDTLMAIAFEYYGDLYQWKRIYEANRDVLSDPNVISTGQVLKVERPDTPVSVAKNGEKYLIKSGDTLGTISSEVYGTQSKWKSIWENNRQLIKDPNKIYAGFYLYYISDGESPAQPLAEESVEERTPSNE